MSTRLGVQHKIDLTAELDYLLGRFHRVMEIPFKPEELIAAYNSIVPEAIHKAWARMSELGYPCGQWLRDGAAMRIDAGGVGYLVEMNLHHNQPDTPENAFFRMPAGKFSPEIQLFGVYPAGASVERAFGPRYKELVDWTVGYSALRDECRAAFDTAKEIVGMTKTAGQLKRMVPELMQYLSTAQRDAINAQKRASSLPYEWAAYPREKVWDMLTTISKCYLMPDTRIQTYATPSCFSHRIKS